MENILLHTENLDIGYRTKRSEKPLAKDLNITLETKNFTCLIGRNGIGKSTLLRTISGLHPPLKGHVIMNKQNVHNLSVSKRAAFISLVLTERVSSGNLTVRELIALGRQPYTNWIGILSDTDKQIIERSIEQTRLENISGQQCDTLSDGQMQRVMIARALAQDTPLIILDEPTAHLDIQHKVEIFRLLKQLACESGKSILVSTHEIHFALEMADNLWILTEKGIQTGSPEKMIRENVIGSIFQDDIIRFDAEKKRFQIK